jgi:hypothetical protein
VSRWTDIPPLPAQPTRGRLAGCLGLASLALLAASIQWAHHWNPRADAIVAAWGIATAAALGVSIWSLRTSSTARTLAKLGLWLAIVSLGALAIAGVAYAAGMNPAGACGGG